MALTDNLISLYELTEASGNATDAVGGFTATEINGPIALSGGLRQFNGSTQRFSVADQAAQSAPGNADFFILVWFNTASNPGNQPLVAKSDASNLEYYLELSSSGGNIIPRLQVSSAASFTNLTAVSWGSAVSTGGLHCLMGWYDSGAGKLRISLDNGAYAEAAYTAGSYDSAAPFLIGGVSPFGQFFSGGAASAGLWVGRVPDATERTTLYNAGTPLPYSAYGGAAGVTLTSPVTDQGFKLTTLSGSSSVGAILIAGTNDSGVTHDFEAALTGTAGTGEVFDGTDWTTIDTGVADGGAISGSLTGVPFGEYSLEVRAVADTAVTATVLRVHVGLVVMTIGQSNPHRFTNNQLKKTVGGATHSAFDKDETWGSLTDPTSAGTCPYGEDLVDSGAAGSALVPAADYARARYGLPLIFVVRNKGATGWAYRVPGVDHDDTDTMYGVYNTDATLCGGINLWWAWLGESDGVDSRSQAAVFADIEDVHDAFWTDQSAAGVLTLLPDSDVPPADLADVNAAIQQGANTLAHIVGLVDLRSPVLLDCNSADGDGSYHIVTDGGAVYCGTLIGEALAAAAGFAAGGGGGSTGGYVIGG